MSISEDSQTLNITNPGRYWTGFLLRVFSWLMVSLTLLFLFNNYLIFWRGWPGLWNFFAHHEWFGISPLRTPLNEENQMLGWIQTIALISIIILNLLFVIKTPNRKLGEDSVILNRFAAYLKVIFLGCIYRRLF